MGIAFPCKRSKRFFALLIVSGLLSACGSRVSSVADTVKFAFSGPQDVTLTASQINQLNYATTYATLSGQPRAAIVLTFIDHSAAYGQQTQWAAQDDEIILLRNGRLYGTRNLRDEFSAVKYDVLGIESAQTDPLNCYLRSAQAPQNCAKSWQAVATVTSDFRDIRYDLTSQINEVSHESVALSNATLDAVKVTETLTVKAQHGGSHKYKNTYWFAHHQLIKSDQQLVPELPRLTTESIKMIGGLEQ